MTAERGGGERERESSNLEKRELQQEPMLACAGAPQTGTIFISAGPCNPCAGPCNPCSAVHGFREKRTPTGADMLAG